MSVRADAESLPLEGFERLADLLRMRPVQFCLLLNALLGAEQMERIMLDAIQAAKR